jgi:hypothetical protein
MKKSLLLFLLVFVCGKSFCQQSPYVLPLPEKWGHEQFAFPLSFAKSIPFKGNEELRFTPGWGNAASGEYWSYTYLWFIEGKPQISSDTLQNYLTVYFNGLFKINDKTKSIDATVSFTKTQINKVKTATNDQETYEGKISTLDFLTGKSIEFFARIHVRNYLTSNRSAILFELSPKPYSDAVWGELDSIAKGFQLKM